MEHHYVPSTVEKSSRWKCAPFPAVVWSDGRGWNTHGKNLTRTKPTSQSFNSSIQYYLIITFIDVFFKSSLKMGLMPWSYIEHTGTFRRVDVSTWHFPRWIRPIVVGGGERDRRDRLGREFFPSLMFLLHFSYGVRMQSEDHFRLIKAKSAY